MMYARLVLARAATVALRYATVPDAPIYVYGQIVETRYWTTQWYKLDRFSLIL